jgi:DNA polymerase elongation subunit (family B)
MSEDTIEVKVKDLANYDDGYEVWDDTLNQWVDVKSSSYGSSNRKYNDFPNPEDPYHTINVITCYDNFSKKFHTFGLKPYTAKLQSNVIYTHCDNERELLIKFIEYMEADYPDILSGWNSEGFDIPYIINRMGHVLGEDYVKRLSPVSNVYYRVMRGQFGQEKKRYYIDGISCLDFLDIYRRFCLKLRESYKLDAIGEVELGEKKVDYSGMSLAELSERDWNKFIDYNIQDVNLLVRLEQKLQYLPLLRMLSYVGLTTLEGAMGTLQVINGALCIKARQRGEVISTFVRSDGEGKNPGAYVAEPKSGFKNHIISFDANSLYPNVMISLNTSPETKVGRVDIVDDNVIIQHVSGKQFSLDKPSFAKFLKKEECSLSKAGFMFTQKKKGIIPEFLEYHYNKRVEIKEKLFKAKQKLKKDSANIDLKYEVERLNTEQMVIKILVNSCYGYMGNKRAPIGDDDIASSVTLTGQAVIKESNKQLKKYINATIDKDITDRDLEECIIYNDTDSSYISITPLIENGIKFWEDREKGLIHQETYDEIQRIEDNLNEGIAIWARKALLTKDPRFVFKRECIADTGIFLQKKRYVMHILDDEGIKENKFKYTGVEVVRTTMPNAIKPYAKKIIETMLSTQSLKETNKVLYETYDIFKTLSPEQIAFVMGVKGYEKYAVQCKQFTTCKGMPIHVKSAYYYNEMLDILETGNKYEKLSSGDKVRYLYIQQPNKYRLDTIGFKYEFPEELGSIFKIDYEKMFEKILFQGIERFYNSVSWPIRKPAANVQTELFELFA